MTAIPAFLLFFILPMAISYTPRTRFSVTDIGTITCDEAFLVVLDRRGSSATCYHIPVTHDGPQCAATRYETQRWRKNAKTGQYVYHRSTCTDQFAFEVATSGDPSFLITSAMYAPNDNNWRNTSAVPVENANWLRLVPEGFEVVSLKRIPLGQEPYPLVAAVRSRVRTGDTDDDSMLRSVGILILEPHNGAYEKRFFWAGSPDYEYVQDLYVHDIDHDEQSVVILHSYTAGASGWMDFFHVFGIHPSGHGV